MGKPWLSCWHSFMLTNGNIWKYFWNLIVKNPKCKTRVECQTDLSTVLVLRWFFFSGCRFFFFQFQTYKNFKHPFMFTLLFSFIHIIKRHISFLLVVYHLSNFSYSKILTDISFCFSSPFPFLSTSFCFARTNV